MSSLLRIVGGHGRRQQRIDTLALLGWFLFHRLSVAHHIFLRIHWYVVLFQLVQGIVDEGELTVRAERLTDALMYVRWSKGVLPLQLGWQAVEGGEVEASLMIHDVNQEGVPR